jgi:chromosome segregation ATPase
LHPLLDVKTWPGVLLRYPLLIVTAFLLGALAGFSYSYAPLHRAKDWKIDYLEERLTSRTNQIEELERELGEVRSASENQPSGEQLDALRAQLAEANGLASSRKKEIAELERELDSANSSRDSWKSKHAQVASKLEKIESHSTPRPTEARALSASPTDDAVEAETAETDPPDATVPASPASSLPEERFPD